MSRLVSRLGRVASGNQAPIAFTVSFPVSWATSKSLLSGESSHGQVITHSQGIAFDGDAWLRLLASLHEEDNSVEFTIAFLAVFDNETGIANETVWAMCNDAGSVSRSNIQRLSSNGRIQFILRREDNHNFATCDSGSGGAFGQGVLRHLVMSRSNDSDNRFAQCYADGGATLSFNSQGDPDTGVNFSQDWLIGANREGQTPVIGKIYDLFVHNRAIDLSVQENREKFYKDGKPVFLGLQGERPFGEPALVYQPKADGTHRGSAPAFTKQGTGALADVEGPEYESPFDPGPGGGDPGNGNGNGNGGEPVGDIFYIAPRWTQAAKGAPFVEATNGDGSSPESPIAGPERIAEVTGLPVDSLTIQYAPGHYIPFNVSANASVLAVHAGGGEDSRNVWRHKNPGSESGVGGEGGQATLWGGIVIHGSVTDHGDGTFTLNGALRSNISFPWFADVGFDGPDKEGVLMRRVFSVEELQADDQYIYYFPGTVATGQSVRVHLPNGENPLYRIMQGGYGYRYNFGGPGHSCTYVDFHDFKYRITSWNTNDPPPTKARWFGLTDIKWSRGSSQYALFPMHQSQGSGNGQRVDDLYFEHVRLEEGRNGLYFVSLQDRGFHGVTVDKIEGYNIANRPQYESSDGHVIACEDYGGFNQVTIGEVISRNTGLPIAVHLSANQETSSCHDFTVVGPVDLEGIGANVANSGPNLNGIGLYGGNAVSAGKWSNVRILTDPTKFSTIKGFVRGLYIHWFDPDEPVLIGYQDTDLETKHILIDDMVEAGTGPQNRGAIGAVRGFFDPAFGFTVCHAIKVRNVEFGPNCHRAFNVVSGGAHGLGVLIDSDWNVFHAEAAQTFFQSPGFGAQTLAQWQSNEAGDNVYDANSVRIDT